MFQQYITKSFKPLTMEPVAAIILESDSDDDDTLIPKSCVNEINILNDNIYLHNKRIEFNEQIDPNDMISIQTSVTTHMRAVLIDWLVDVCDKFEFLQETLFISVKIIDKFLSKRVISKSKFQLLGITALYLSAKYEEFCLPETGDFVLITDNAFTLDELLKMEIIVLNAIGFKLTFPTPNKFLDNFSNSICNIDEYDLDIAKFLIEKTLQDHTMLRYVPSKIASSALYIANEQNKRICWSRELESYTGYSIDDLMECIEDIRNILRNPSTSLNAIERKYTAAQA